MVLDIPVSSFVNLSDRLSCLSDNELVLVVDILADLGLCVSRRSDGGFDFESLINRAKRLVVEELMKIGRKE